MQAHEYPVTFGFRGIFMPYYGNGGSIYPGHHGIDWGTPVNTPVVVSGVTIARTGNTGLSTGPHLHVDKHRTGSRDYGGYRDPSDFPNITGTVTFTGWANSAGNMVVIRADNGHIYRFLHLEKILVKEGDTIQDMYRGRTAQDWAKVADHATSVATTRSNRLRAIESKYGNAGYPITASNETAKWHELAEEINLVFNQLNTAKGQLAQANQKIAELEAREPEVVTVTETVTNEVDRPLTWKRVVDWVLSKVRR